VVIAFVVAAALGGILGVPRGFPLPAVPADNPPTAAKIELGRHLFYDRRLSGNGTQSCADCHRQELAFTDGRARAVGSTGQTHPRAAMALANSAYAASLTWTDSKVRTLEQQALRPLTNRKPVEMGFDESVSRRIRAVPKYRTLFAAAFPGQGVTLTNIARAIASFERSIISGRSRYDRYVFDGEPLSDSEKRGMRLFFGERAGCGTCHSGIFLGGRSARFEQGFRVPSLRNVAVTAPYRHDGSVATLDAVIERYAKRKPFTITVDEKRDLIAFLGTLTDEELLTDARLSNPWAKPRSIPYQRHASGAPAPAPRSRNSFRSAAP
jgi:cytochrome c peroxidase